MAGTFVFGCSSRRGKAGDGGVQKGTMESRAGIPQPARTSEIVQSGGR